MNNLTQAEIEKIKDFSKNPFNVQDSIPEVIAPDATIALPGASEKVNDPPKVVVSKPKSRPKKAKWAGKPTVVSATPAIVQQLAAELPVYGKSKYANDEDIGFEDNNNNDQKNKNDNKRKKRLQGLN